MTIPAVVLTALLTQSEPIPNTALAIGAGTDFPLSVGAYVRSEPAGALVLGTAIGLLPRGYADLISGALVSFNAFDERTGLVVSDALTNALVWRAHLGLRPSAASGFYFTGGYTFIGLGGNVTAAEAIYAFTGSSPPSSANGLSIDARAFVHQLGVELGWRWRVGGTFAIEAALGGAYTFSAKSDLIADASPAVALAAEPALLAAEAYLDQRLQDYVHSAYLSLRGYFEIF